ncbi:hypothetical protein CLAFUW4_07549 [Fulvia fulva]|uniref:Uncharacterized protein n=1 Tax=Passalora fulva TaxID=5499 RepID=A0A9Q8PBR5_PASFU|nr:uncharacterized protein CLAFUR5_07680 [Fulvia fulva]KAK4621972.1 hypothetical protein CLAFUR4_07555 [Fulvia fulva]KAK4622677.1 hypothetical protein CLAFUR0_07554 [Fulvia fulva]UJO19515.1 hypothetical protein CLAFUR5_07680 [Fulvia fulva]WPV16653.1 hypothetical protein CLAFUW4_07549 [Fulvia fulva]WPV31638.1 hypothetical protein CLAFUW7_07551 [Fulvia fulva]
MSRVPPFRGGSNYRGAYRHGSLHDLIVDREFHGGLYNQYGPNYHGVPSARLGYGGSWQGRAGPIFYHDMQRHWMGMQRGNVRNYGYLNPGGFR